MFVSLIRLLLGLVFAIAGVTKLIDMQGTRESLSNFGVPKSATPVFTFLLPLTELAVFVGLLFSATAWSAALAGFLLLCLFSVVIAINLQRGQTHECHCFGQLYSRPLGRGSLIRNGAFELLALFIIIQGPTGAGPNLWSAAIEIYSAQPLAMTGATIVVVAAMVFWIHLSRKKNLEAAQVRAEETKSNGLPINSKAPDFELMDFDERPGSLKRLLTERKPVMLLFANPKCGPCAAIFHEVGHWQKDFDTEITIAVISQGTVKDNFVNTARNNLRRVYLQSEREVADLYDAKLTPSAVLVLSDGRIGSSVVAGADDIRALLGTVVPTVNGHSH